jgi:hypothetical protein
MAGGVSVLDRTGPGLTITTTFWVIVQPRADMVYAYVTAMGADVVFVRISSGLLAPEVGPAGKIPGMLARVQLNDVPAVALVGV